MPIPRIAVDAVGGDHAPAVVVDGAVAAARSGRLAVTLVGPSSAVHAELARHDIADLDVLVVEAPDVVEMGERPLAALRRKPRSSIRVAAELVATGRAAGMFTAGNSGVAVLAAHTAIGTMPGVDRPALAVLVPTRAGATVLLDVGANVECRPEHLEEFARLGASYASIMLGVERPRVGLLSIGEEVGKGNDLIRDVHERLAAGPLDYLGNLEARHLFTGKADVAVCDGFTGNIALKVGEGLVEVISAMIQEELNAELVSKVGEIFTRRAFDRFHRRLDAAEYGAAPLLGIDGLVLVGHGRSSVRAVEAGITLAARLAEARLIEQMGRARLAGQ